MGFLKKIISQILEVFLKLCKGMLTVLLVFYCCGAFEWTDKSPMELINRLDNNYPWAIRKNAAEKLQEIGEPAIEDLLYALKNKNKHIRRKIPQILSEIKNPTAMEPLRYALDDTDEVVSDKAMGALCSLTKEDVDVLIPLLEKGKDSIKIKALYAIGSIASYKRMEDFAEEVHDLEENSTIRLAVMPITALLKGKNPFVKIKALWTLRRIKDQRSVPSIIPLLKDNNLNVRIAAIETLGILGGEQSLKALIKLLDETNWRVRMETVTALGRIKNNQAVEPLVKRLEDSDWRVLYRTIIALGSLQDERAVVPLQETFERQDSLMIKRFIIIALGNISHKRAIDFLVSVLNHKDDVIKVNAVYALGKIGKPAVKTLLKMLKQTDNNAEYLRANVIGALGNIGDPRTIDPIIGALKHSSWRVRDSAVIALEKFKNKRAFDGIVTALGDKDRDIRSLAIGILSRAHYCRAYNALKRISETDPDERLSSYAKDALKSMEKQVDNTLEKYADGIIKLSNICKCSGDKEIEIKRYYYDKNARLIKFDNLIEHTETRFFYYTKKELKSYLREIPDRDLKRTYGDSCWYYERKLKDGVKRELNFKNFKFHGELIEWDLKGIIKKKEIWENGKLVKKIK